MSQVLVYPSHGVVALPKYSDAPSLTLADQTFNNFKNKAFVGKSTPAVVRQLHDMGVDLMLPATERLPGRYTPMAHQLETVKALLRHRRILVRDDMGTGKTASAIWAMHCLMKLKAVRRTLILCPLSCVQSVWMDEMFNLVPDVRASPMLSQGGVRRYKQLESGEFDDAAVLVMNHDGIRSTVHSFLRHWKPDLIIVDEAAVFRNPGASRSKALVKLIREADPIVWPMTGTPTPNSPADAVGIAKLLNPDSWATMSWFRAKHMFKLTQNKWVPRKSAYQAADDLMRPTIRHKREDCLDLPELTYSTRDVEMTPEQTKSFKKMQVDLAAEFDGEVVTAVNAAVAVSKLLQITNGFIYAKNLTNGSTSVKMINNSRVKVLAELVEECDGPLIVFCLFKQSAALIAEHFASTSNITTATINGDIGQKKRQEIFADFQAGNIKLLIAQPQAMAHGVTLTAANTTVWYGPILSNEQYQQANARFYRKGQNQHCHIIHLQGTQHERDIYNTLKRKGRMQDTILRLAENLT